MDVEGILARQRKVLDVAHVRRWLDEPARVSDDPEVASCFERAWAERGLRDQGIGRVRHGYRRRYVRVGTVERRQWAGETLLHSGAARSSKIGMTRPQGTGE